MSRKTANGFGAQSYWNRPSKGRQRKLTPKFITNTQKAKQTTVNPPSRSPSPTPSQSPFQSSKITIVSPSHSVPKMPTMSKEEENDEKDEKSIAKLMKSTLPQFSNEVDWEMAIFELGLSPATWKIGQTSLSTLHLPYRPRKTPTQKRRF